MQLSQQPLRSLVASRGHSMRNAPPRGRCPHIAHQQRRILRLPPPCFRAPGSKDEQDTSAAGPASSSQAAAPAKRPHAAEGTSDRDVKASRKLINQLLQIRSVSSMQSIDLPVEELDGPGAQQQQQQQLESSSSSAQPLASSSSTSTTTSTPPATPPSTPAASLQGTSATSLFDDPAAADYDPLVLDMLGFTSVSEYLDSKLAAAAGEAKVSVIAVLIWALAGALVMLPLGGPSVYSDSIAILTDGGLEMSNMVFLWVGLLTYFSAKGCVMAFALSLRSWRLHEEQGERLEELAATVELREQRRAFWRLQDKLQKADERAKRTYTEFALSSLLLGVLLLMSGGTDNLTLQMETVDEESYRVLLVVLPLFFEAYFAAVGAFTKVCQWGSAGFDMWNFNRKWGGKQ